MKLPILLKREINKAAHAAGIAHAKSVRAELIAAALASQSALSKAFLDLPVSTITRGDWK